MSRDHRELRVFNLADTLVTHIYKATNNFPAEERYREICAGLQALIAALSTES